DASEANATKRPSALTSAPRLSPFAGTNVPCLAAAAPRRALEPVTPETKTAALSSHTTRPNEERLRVATAPTLSRCPLFPFGSPTRALRQTVVTLLAKADRLRAADPLRSTVPTWK